MSAMTEGFQTATRRRRGLAALGALLAVLLFDHARTGRGLPGTRRNRGKLRERFDRRYNVKSIDEEDGGMTTERFLNAYHNASTAPSPDVPADIAGFMLAADPSSPMRRSSLGYSLGLIGSGRAADRRGWAHARKYISEKYADWADYRAPAKGYGIRVRTRGQRADPAH